MRVHSPQSTVHGSAWRVLIDEARSAAGHMAYDERLAREDTLTVRFFRWDPPAISLGFKQPLPAWLNPFDLRPSTFDLVERPTGGGIAFHGSDVSFAVVLPRTDDRSPRSIMTAICGSAQHLCASYGIEATTLLEQPGTERITYCLLQPSSYAVLIGDRKVAGLALRRYPQSWLIQGSLLARPLPQPLRSALPIEVVERLDCRAVSLEQAAGCPPSEPQVIDRWAAHWSMWWDEVRYVQTR